MLLKPVENILGTNKKTISFYLIVSDEDKKVLTLTKVGGLHSGRLAGPRRDQLLHRQIC